MRKDDQRAVNFELMQENRKLKEEIKDWEHKGRLFEYADYLGKVWPGNIFKENNASPEFIYEQMKLDKVVKKRLSPPKHLKQQKVKFERSVYQGYESYWKASLFTKVSLFSINIKLNF